VDHYLNFSKKLPDLPCAGEALRRVTITKFCYFLECARFELVNWTMRMRAEDFSYQQAIKGRRSRPLCIPEIRWHQKADERNNPKNDALVREIINITSSKYKKK